jgi:hypothetical protein
MSAAPGIAGSLTAEVAGVFLCTDRAEAGYFVRLNNTGGPVDVWQVRGIDFGELLDAGSGYLYLPRPVDAASVRLTVLDEHPSPTHAEPGPTESSGAPFSELTLTFDQHEGQPGE